MSGDLGPIDQDPDAIRDAACRLVASDRVCRPAQPPDTRPPHSAGGGSGGAVDFVSLLLWVALVALVVVLVVLAVRSLAQRRAKGARGHTDEAVEVRSIVRVDHRRDPADWRREAEEHRRAGRYRDALRCRYRALVGDLARGGVIDEIPGRTTGEERRQMHEVAPAAAAPFATAADLFDDAWYGGRPVDAASDDRFAALEREVLTRAAGGSS